MIKKSISSVVTIVSVFLIITLLVSMTYMVTLPRIESNRMSLESDARLQVLPEADGFSQLSEIELADNVTEVYSATNGSGYAVTSTIETDAGDISVITGLNLMGEVTGIRIIDSADGTPDNSVKNYTDLRIEALKTDYAGTTRIDSMISDFAGDAYSASDVLGAVSAAIMQLDYLGGSF